MLKGIRISEYGILHIKKGNEYKEQLCPFSPHSCYDDCPLFGEPDIDPDNILKDTEVRIDICNNKTLSCLKENFEDLREAE